MWTVWEKKTIARTLQRCPKAILIRYEAWKRIVELQGPLGLRQIKGFHDEALKGNWRGFRSSRLGLQWRVMYTTEGHSGQFYVVEVTPHKY